MNRTAAFCLAAACLLSAGSAAQASKISWSYQFVPAGNASNNVILTGTGAGNKNTGSAQVVAVHTPVFSSTIATAGNPQAVDVPFAVNLRFTDKTSGLSEFVSFSGTLSGNIWGSNRSNLVANFSSLSPQTVDINHHLYTVTPGAFTPPAGGHAGSLAFNVNVHHNPEPSSLILAAIGAPFFGVTLRRRRRRG